MRPLALTLVAGLVSGSLLPAASWPSASLLAVAILACYWRRLRLPALALIAALYSHASVEQVRSQQSAISVPRDLVVRAAVESVRGRSWQHQRATIRLLADVPGTLVLRRGDRLRVSWYHGSVLTRGEQWQFQLRVKPAAGLSNPGGFDYQRWLLAERLVASGSIRGALRLRRAPDSGLAGLRGRLAAHLRTVPEGEWLMALLLGDRSALSAQQMERVRASGIVHLLVVSGLHVSIVGGLGGWLGRVLGHGLVALRRRGDARWLSYALALLSALLYVLLAGTALPAVRALLMAMATGLVLLAGRVHQAGDVLLLVLLAMLLADPLIVHGAGTWLSFTAVAALLWYWLPRRSPSRWWQTLLASQMLLALVSAVLLTEFGNPVASAGPLANLFAVPLVTLLVVPLGLLAAIAWMLELGVAEPLWSLASQGLLLMWWVLQHGREAPLWHFQQPGWLALMTVTGGLLFGVRILDRWSAGAAIAAVSLLLISVRDDPRAGAFALWIFDVGQGSAALVQTRGHTLLFDAAPAYASGADLGRDLVVPAMAQLGERSLDALIISHEDLDHAGGAGAVLSAFPNAQVWRSVGAGQRCQRGLGWEWDGVRFEFLHPEAHGDLVASSNEASCVLQIRSAQAGALLTGDIGRPSERALVRHGLNSSDVVLVPHHGSNGSSTAAFVRLLRPRFAIVSAGRFNAYGHPHARVQDRYQAVGARLLNTATHGAIAWYSDQPGTIVSARTADPAAQ